MKLKDYIQQNTCSTAKISGLSYQIIDEMNLLIPNLLVNFEDLPNVDVSGGPQINPFLQPAAKEALRRALRDNPGKILKVNSALRTVAQQYFIYRKWQRGQCFPAAAKPSRSNHEDGFALDINNWNDWKNILPDYRWEWFGSGDKVHFTYVGGGVRDDVGNIGVKAFQRLWNKHNRNDKIDEDGLYGNQTARRLDLSPIEGFGAMRLLKLADPPMEGEDVRKVQQALVNEGFLTQEQVNGIYDQTTKQAVEKFQEQEDLLVDGIVGSQTRRALGIPRWL